MSIVLRSEGIFEKPLYYYMKGHVFYYSYDIRDICRKPDVDLSINEKHFYLRNSGHNSLTLTETDFKYIKVIKPGTECTFDETPSGWSMSEKVFWEPGHSKYNYKSYPWKQG